MEIRWNTGSIGRAVGRGDTLSREREGRMIMTSRVYEIADRFIEDMAAVNPLAATRMGVPGHEDRMPDLSPDGQAEMAGLVRRTMAELTQAPIDGHRDRIARALMQDRLEVSDERYAAREHERDVRTLGSTLGAVRSVFDLMRYDSDDDWAIAARRMQAVPDAVDGWVQTQRAGMADGVVAARRQAASVARQASVWSGIDADASRPFFHALADRYEQSPGRSDAVLADLRTGADRATAAFADASRFLSEEYHPAASERDAVGVERYRREARSFLGAEIDPHETYEWGWEELARIESRAREVCDQIVPGSTWAEAVEHLENDSRYVIEGVEDFQAWNQELIDATIAEMDGVHFEIAEPLRRCEAMIAPPGGAAAMYYTAPSEDLTRPGRTWYPTLGKTRFPLWREVSICYHEGSRGIICRSVTPWCCPTSCRDSNG
jgi:uncharacterized protein (DUF885 family)